MENYDKNKVLRQVVGALVASKLSIAEVERFRSIVKSDRAALDLVFDSCLSSLRSLDASDEIEIKARKESERYSASNLYDEVLDLVEMGLIPRDRILQAIYQSGVLGMSISTMKKKSIRSLVERALVGMSKSEAKKFLSTLSSVASEDSYLRGIESKRGV